MTRALRRSHLAAWLVLTPAVLGALILALAMRAQADARLAHQAPPRSSGQESPP